MTTLDSPIPRFHLAMPVDDLAAASRFYGDVLGLTQGRSADTWIIVVQSEAPLRDVVVCMLSKYGESATAFRLVFETGMRAAASSPSSLIPHCLASSSTGNTMS